MSLSIKQIRYFVAVAELGQISLAAQHLHITQSAVTIAIKELEKTMDTILLNRLHDGISLTGSGKHFLNHCRDILNSVNACMNINHEQHEIAGTLRVATTYTVIGYYLPHHLNRLKHIYPKLNIEVTELNRSQVEQGLINDEYDIALVLSANVENKDLMIQPFHHSQRNLWLSASHPLINKGQVHFKDLQQFPYIVFTADEADITTQRYWQAAGYNPNISLRTSSVEAVRSMVANNYGITILSDMVYRQWSLEGKRIEKILMHDPVPAMSLGLAWKKEQADTTLLKAFRSYFSHPEHSYSWNMIT